MFTSVLILYVCVFTIVSACPPNSGIYLILNGECRSNGTYFRDSDLDISKVGYDNRIHCVLPGETMDDGEWLRPDGQPVNCNDDAKPDPFVCNNTISRNANITLYLNDDDDFAPLVGGNDQHNVELQYKCCLPTNCSDPNTNIMIINVFERVYITEIYVDLPFDITVIPQYYTIHCVVTGSYVATVAHYYDNTQVTESYCNEQSCSFKNETLHTSNFTYDLSVKWKIGEYGDHYHKCNARDGQIMRKAIVKVTAPTSSPSIPTLVSNTFTSITINWTYPDISDTDGYVVNASSLNDYVIQQVNGSSVNETILNGLIPGTTYNITIRAYQDLLGPASEPLSVDTLNDIAIYLISYTVDGSTTIVSWEAHSNGSNITGYTIIFIFCDGEDKYTLDKTTTEYTIIGLDNSVINNITIVASNGEVNLSTSILTNITDTPPPPPNISAVMLNYSSIQVRWSELSCENHRNIIMYTVHVLTHSNAMFVLNVSADSYSTVLTNLPSNSTYIISIATWNNVGHGKFSNGTKITIPQAVPGAVQNLNIQFNSATLSWNPPVYNPFPVTKYEVSYRMCDQSFNEVMESKTSNTSYTITGLQSDTCYIFIVLAYNGKGAGEEVHVNVTTLKLNGTTVDDSILNTPLVTQQISPILEDVSRTSFTKLNEATMVPRKSDVPSGISHSITNTNEKKSKVTTGMFPSITNTNEVGSHSSNDCSAVCGILGTLVGILTGALIGCITAIIILSVLYIKQRNKALPTQSKLQTEKTQDEGYSLHMKTPFNTDYDIPQLTHNKIEMQECEPYGLHKMTTPNTVIYDECNPSDVSIYETIS